MNKQTEPVDVLAAAAKRIKAALVEQAGTGCDVDMCCEDAASAILGELLREAHHTNPDGSFASWKRMPPGMRAALARVGGAK